MLEDLGVKDGDGSKPNALQSPASGQLRESGNDQNSVASSNQDLSAWASPGILPVVVEDTKSNHEISPTNSAEVEQGSPRRVPSPRQSPKTQAKEKKSRHSAMFTDDAAQKSMPSLSPLEHRRFTGAYQQEIHLSPETFSTQQRSSDESVLEPGSVSPQLHRKSGSPGSVSPQLRRKSGSPRLMRKHAIRGPRRPIVDDSSASSQRPRSFSTSIQQSTFSTTHDVSQNRRYTMPALERPAGRSHSTADKLNAVEERGEEINTSAVHQSLSEGETVPVNGMMPAGNSNQCTDPGEHNEPLEACTELPENSPGYPIPE